MQAVSRHHVIIGGALLLPALLIGLLSTAAFLLNHSRLHDLLLHQVKTQLGIEVSTLRLQLFPTARLDVSDLVMRDPASAEPSVRAGRASLSIRLWPLMTKRTAMVTLEAIQPEVSVRRDEDGRWHVPLIDVDRPEAPSETSSGQWSVTDVVLKDGTLRIFDPARLKSDGIAVHHVQAMLHSDPAGTGANVLFSGATDDGGSLNLSGTLRLNGSDAWNRSHSKQFNGALHFHDWNFAYWLERAGQYVLPQDWRERGKLSANIRLDFPENSDGFNAFASDMIAETAWLTIRGHMLITGAGTEHPVYAMALSTSPVSSATLFAHIPSSWLPEQIQTVIDQHKLAGTIQVHSLGLRGRMDILREPDEWRVAAKLTDASARWGNTTTTIRHVSGTVLMDRTHGELRDVSGDINGVRVTSDKLSVGDMDVIPTLDASLNAYGEVERVMAVLKQFTPGTEANSVVQTIRNASGRLGITVHVAGPLMPKPSLQLLKAEMRLENAGAALSSGLSIDAVNGIFVSDSHMVRLRDVSGVFKGIRFQAQGTIDVASTTRLNDLQVAISSSGRAIEELFATYLPSASGLRVAGPVRSTVRLSGSPTAVHCDGTIDVTESEISVPSMLHKKKGVPGLVEWEGKLFDKTRILVDRLRVGLSNSAIDAAGEMDLTHVPRFRWHVQAGPLSVHELVESGMNIPITRGVVGASAVIRGEGTDWKRWLPSGSITIREGEMTMPALGESLSSMNGRIRFSPQSVAFDNVTGLMGEAEVKLTGSVEQWRNHPRARLLVESSDLNVSTFLPTRRSNNESTGMRIPDWIRSQQAAITFLVKQLRYERLVLKTVSGELRVNGQKATVNDLQAETSRGTLSGRVEAQFAPKDQIDLAAYVSVDGIPAEHLLAAASGEQDRLQGDVSMDGVFQARIDAHSPLKNTLTTGHDGMVLKVTNGRLHQDPVLTRVLKVLNLPAVLFGGVDIDHAGIPFDSLSARVTGQNGVFSSQNIVLDSPVIKVAGAGSADLRANGLDLAVAVSPVASYSDLLARIPLLGPLIVGDHSGLTTAVFQARGSLLNPEIAYLPLVSLARGVSAYPRLAVDLLAQAIKLPPTALAYVAE